MVDWKQYCRAILPFNAFSIVLDHPSSISYQGRSFDLFHSPEWSFISCIFFGQTLVKFIASAVRVQASWQAAIMVSAGIIVLLIIPSSVILSLILITDPPSNSLALTQMGGFLLSVVLYFALGKVSQEIIEEKDR